MKYKAGIIAIALALLFAPGFVSAAPDKEPLFARTMRSGARGEAVRQLQIFLKQFPKIYPQGLTTGFYGGLTRAAVRRFQQNYKLRQTGVVDEPTRTRLNDIAARIVNPSESAPPPPPKPTARPAPIPAVTPTPTVTTPYFKWSWRAGADIVGEIRLPTPAPKPVFVLDGTPTVIAQSSAATKLAQKWKIALLDDEVPWDASSATMLYEMLRRLPNHQFNWQGYRSWRVSLTDEALPNDIQTTDRHARISRAAFVRSNPTLQPSADGNADRVFYSNRLFRAVLKIFYDDRYLLEQAIETRYGYKIGFGEPGDEFQQFTIDELQFLAGVLEDLPSGFRSIPGLKQIVRRKTGLTNPHQPNAPAIAQISQGYIEFMDIAFESANLDYIARLIAHEMTHFLWHKVLTVDTKKRFAAFSDWQEVGADRWTHRTTANFVSDYAAAYNPDEDFAETISFYIYEPDLVRTLAPDKYAFVKDVVDGYEYVLLVDRQFTFQVFNLEPDTTFPGKIVGIDNEVTRLANGDSAGVSRLRLSPKYGDGAVEASMRLFSPVETFLDVRFYPENGNAFVLKAEYTIVKNAAHGYWVPGEITVRDAADNRRYEGQGQFEWLFYIDNPEEDLDAPVPDPSRITSTQTSAGGETTITIRVPATDKHTEGLYGGAYLVHASSDQREHNWGSYDAASGSVVFTYVIRRYRASGEWSWREFNLFDFAGNGVRHDLKERELKFQVTTPNPDHVKPELDVPAIRVVATPTKPAHPDGETNVTITYRARDDNSGLGWVSYTLLKPNGQTLFDWHIHENFHTAYFEGGRAQDWKTYTIQLRLPPGSPPGIWALKEIDLKDKAGNALTSNFVEVGILRRFDVL